MADRLYSMPTNFFSGDTLLLSLTASINSGDVGTLALVGINGLLSATGVSTGSAFEFDLDTSTLGAGRYQWIFYTTSTGGSRTTLSSGFCVCAVDIASSTVSLDVRLFARKIADALESIINGRATSEQLGLVSQSCAGLNVGYIDDVYSEWIKWSSEATKQEAQLLPQSDKRKNRALYGGFGI